MKKIAKLRFAGDYFPGWQSSKNISDKLKYLFKYSALSYKDRLDIIKSQSNLINKILMPYRALNAKLYSLEPLELLNDFFKDTSFNCINLETSLSNSGKPIPEKLFNLKCEPFYIEGLLSYNINLAILANNHILDYGEKSVLETIELLEKYKIDNSGINFDSTGSEQNALIRDIEGVTVGFLSYVDSSIIDPSPDVFYSQSLYPYKLDKEQVLKDITRAKKETDIVIINCHWGDEWSHLENESQVTMAHSMVDAGASAVIGHHPHVVQGIERYKNGLIAYSLGNLFMFLGGISRIRSDKTVLLEIDFTKDGIESYKTHTISHNQKGQPYLTDYFDKDDLDLNKSENQIDNDSEFYLRFKNSEIIFSNGNQKTKGEWKENFSVDRIIYKDAWCSGSAYAALGKEFCGKNLKRSIICHSDCFDSISISIPDFEMKKEFYFGFPNWYEGTSETVVGLEIKFGDKELLNKDINYNKELNHFSFDNESFEGNKNDLCIKISGNHLNCLFGF